MFCPVSLPAKTFNNRLVGLVMIGRIEGAGIYRYLIREGRDIAALKPKIVAGLLHAGDLTYG